MRFSENSAKNIAPLFDGFSFFAIVRAAPDNFRHHGEWARTRRNSARQKQSISILAAVLREHLANPEIEARGPKCLRGSIGIKIYFTSPRAQWKLPQAGVAVLIRCGRIRQADPRLTIDSRGARSGPRLAVLRDGRVHLSGLTVRAVATQLGIARSSAGRLRQKAQEEGLLDSDDESEAGGGEDDSGTLY